MPTQAIAATGIQLRLGDGVVPHSSPIASASTAAPIIIGMPGPHGIVDVTLVDIVNVGGNTAANGRWIAEVAGPNHVALRGSVGNAAYTGGGALTVLSTFAPIAEVTNITDAGVTSTLVDVSAHDSGLWTSRIPTMLSGNMMRVDVNFVPTHPTHNPTTGLEYLLLNRIPRPWLLVFPDVDKTTWAFEGYVASFVTQGPVAQALTAAITLEFINEAILAAA